MGINDLSREIAHMVCKAYRDFARRVEFYDLVVTIDSRYGNLKGRSEFEVGVLSANLIMIS